jgi:sec-independent protein translocase protein TatA
MNNERKNAMFEGLFQPMHLMIIAGFALLVFGPKKLPELGKGLGESIRGFKAAMAAKEEAAVAAKPVETVTTGDPRNSRAE